MEKIMNSENKRSNKGNSLTEFVSDYIVLDIETTGFSPEVNEIIEIGAIKVRNFEVCDTYHALIKIENEIPETIVRLTGITNEMLNKDGIQIEDALTGFKNFIEDFILVGHNINFDINFLYDNFVRYSLGLLTNDFIDTMRLSKMLVKDIYNYKLSSLTKKFNINYEIKHRSLDDVYATNNLYKKLKDYQKNYISERMKEIEPHLINDENFKNKKVSVKTKLKYLDANLISNILERYSTKVYSFMSKNADILIVNDNTYKKLQMPLDNEDPYLHFFNEWMFTAQKKLINNELTIISETDFCNKIGIPINCKIEKEIDKNNLLYNKVCVFTGTLERFTRKQAESIVASIGGIVGKGVTKETSYLILGNNDYNSAVKNGKTSKHKKAEELQIQGQEIEIIPEDVFYNLIGED